MAAAVTRPTSGKACCRKTSAKVKHAPEARAKATSLPLCCLNCGMMSLRASAQQHIKSHKQLIWKLSCPTMWPALHTAAHEQGLIRKVEQQMLVAAQLRHGNPWLSSNLLAFMKMDTSRFKDAYCKAIAGSSWKVHKLRAH